MGVCDLIPGISGGSFAFILGFYPRLISSLNAFNFSEVRFFLKNKKFSETVSSSFFFLFWLFLGMGSAFVLLSFWVGYLFKDPIYRVYLYSLFFGVLLGSIRQRRKRVVLWNKKRFLFFLCGFCLSFSITFLQGGDFLFLEEKGFSVFLVLSGMLTVFAMLLPGISGSYILLLLGVYIPALEALSSLWTLQKEAFLFLGQLALGAFLGFFLFARILTFLQKKQGESVEASLLGFLLGSLGFIWPYGSYIHTLHRGTQVSLTNHELVFSFVFLVLGYFLLQRTSKKGEKTLPLID